MLRQMKASGHAKKDRGKDYEEMPKERTLTQKEIQKGTLRSLCYGKALKLR